MCRRCNYLDTTIYSAGDVVFDVILSVLVERNDVIERLNGVVYLSDIRDVDGKLFVLCGKSAGTVSFFVGAPAGSAGLKCGIADEIFCCIGD